ncbi:MAG: 50S ribosomal protein L21 [Anaerolineae bacterium CG2_30_58_95]|nr:MAG: 50S ribosomal protein L21 [Anaerolineae bacterium CG2_30_58_95]
MKYAIVESGGKQYRAVEGEAIQVDRLPVPAGEDVKLEKVLLLVDGENVTVGMPTVKDMNVFAKVAEHFKGPKVVIFKYSPKKRIRVKTGHRQNYTRLQVEQIGSIKVAKIEEPAEITQPVLIEEPLVTVEAPAKEKAAKTPAARKEKAPAETKATRPATVRAANNGGTPVRDGKTSKATAEKKATKPAKTSKAAAEKKATKAAKTPAAKKATKTTKTTTASKTRKTEKK